MGYCVLLPSYSHATANVRPGLSYHLACQALALREAAVDRDVRVCIASTPEEDARGLWDRVRASFPAEDIFALEDELTSFVRLCGDLIEKEGRVVAHVQGTRQLRSLASLKRRFAERLKIVYTVHSFKNATWRRIPYCLVLSRLLRQYADYTIFLSPFAMGQFTFCERVIAGGRGGFIPLGVELPDEGNIVAPTSDDLDENLLQLLEKSDAFRFIYLAAFKAGKGHRWLVEGAAPVLQRHANASIILAGWGDEKIQRDVRRCAERVGVSSQIVTPGSIGRELVPWVLDRCDAGVVPSFSETFGQCITEPMAHGLPVVGTRKGIGESLIVDHHTGFGVEYGDVVGLDRALERLVNHRAETARMGANARALVRETLNWARVARAQLGIYDTLMAN